MSDGLEEMREFFGAESQLPKVVPREELTEDLLAEYLKKQGELFILEAEVKALKRKIEALAPEGEGKQQTLAMGKHKAVFKRRVYLDSIIGPSWKPEV